MRNNSKGFAPILIILLIAVVALVGGYFVYSKYSQTSKPIPPPNQVACTQEAKLCSDGSSVGRTGPKCEFTPCPSSISTGNQQNNSCTSKLLNLAISYPHNWTCTTESASDTIGWLTLKSDLFDVEISNGGRGPYCGESADDPNCKTTPFYTDNIFSLTTYNSDGQDKELFGTLKLYQPFSDSKIWVSVKYKNMETTSLSNAQKQELIDALDSLTISKNN